MDRDKEREYNLKMAKKINHKRVFKWLYYTFFGFLILIALLLIFSAFPIPGNYRLLVVKSGSMEPAIKMGSLVVIKPQNDYKIGDIITFGPFSKNHPPTTHRIHDIKITGGSSFYITKGDANNAPDQREISQKDIIGKVIFSIPYIGYAIEAAKKPIGFLLIIIVPALLIIFDEVKKILKEIQDKRNSSLKKWG